MRCRRIALPAFGVDDGSIDEKEGGKQWTRVQADVVDLTTRFDVINCAARLEAISEPTRDVRSHAEAHLGSGP